MTLTASFNIFWLDTRIEGLDLPKKSKAIPLFWVIIQDVIKCIYFISLLRLGATIFIFVGDILLMGHLLKLGGALFFILN